MTTNLAIEYVESLRLGRNSYQCYETWEREDAHMSVLAIFDSGYEVQTIIMVPTNGDPVRWIPCRIFASPGGRNGLFRGACLWFNPEEVESDVMAEHNRRVAA